MALIVKLSSLIKRCPSQCTVFVFSHMLLSIILFYSISYPNKHGEPTLDLSSDARAVIHNKDKLTNIQLNHHVHLILK